MSDFLTELNKRILFFDGGIGTMLATHDLTEDQFSTNPPVVQGFCDLLNITTPQIVQDIHYAYLNSGADIITTNSFMSNKHQLEYLKLSDILYDLNYKSASLAKQVVSSISESDSKIRFVAGSIGPIPVEVLEENDIRESYLTQANALLDGGADLLILETMVNIQSLMLALNAIDQINNRLDKQSQVIVMISYPAILPLLSPVEWIKTFVETIENNGFKNLITAIGINCVADFDIIDQQLTWLEANTDYKTIIAPSAGLPDSSGIYPVTPKIFSDLTAELLNHKSIRLLGGCCGTTPEHIQFLRTKYRLIFDSKNRK